MVDCCGIEPHDHRSLSARRSIAPPCVHCGNYSAYDQDRQSETFAAHICLGAGHSAVRPALLLLLFTTAILVRWQGLEPKLTESQSVVLTNYTNHHIAATLPAGHAQLLHSCLPAFRLNRPGGRLLTHAVSVRFDAALHYCNPVMSLHQSRPSIRQN